MSEHTRNQKRMYRIHKQEEKILEQELMITSLQQKVEQLENIRKEAVEIINQYMPNYASCVKAFDELENILKKGDNNGK